MATAPVPKTWTDDEIVTAADLNKEVRDVFNFLLTAHAFFKGTMAGGVAIAANTNMPWVTQEMVGGGTFASNVYTVPEAGLYRVTFSVKWNGTATTTPGKIMKNGTAVFIGPNAPSLAYGGFTYSHLVRFDLGDEISTQVNVAITTQSDAPAENNMLAIEWVRP